MNLPELGVEQEVALPETVLVTGTAPRRYHLPGCCNQREAQVEVERRLVETLNVPLCGACEQLHAKQSVTSAVEERIQQLFGTEDRLRDLILTLGPDYEFRILAKLGRKNPITVWASDQGATSTETSAEIDMTQTDAADTKSPSSAHQPG